MSKNIKSYYRIRIRSFVRINPFDYNEIDAHLSINMNHSHRRIFELGPV